MGKARAIDPAIQLAAKAIAVLEERRGLGANRYPVPLDQLFPLADGEASPELIAAARGKIPFKKRVVIARKDDPRSPVVLAEDLETLAADGRLLEAILTDLCGPEARLHSVTALSRNLDTRLKKPFAASLARMVQDQSLPPTVGAAGAGKAVKFYLRCWPPPPTPVELSELFVAELERRRASSEAPATVRTLVEATRPDADPAVVRKALSSTAFKKRVVVALTGHDDSPLGLHEDRDRLAILPELLELTLTAERLAPRHVAALADLAKHLHASLRKPFVEGAQRQIQGDMLPATVELLWHKKLPLFLPASQRIPAPASVPVALDSFAEAFAEAFAKLDRQGGSNNFVSLVELRRTLDQFDRATFDSGLRELRRSGRFSLRAVEGWSSLTAEQREAAIVEDGTHYLYITRVAT